MDKRTLSRQEMATLRDFIVSRSARFAEPAILLEILDHFACKTEELLRADASLTLEQAMKEAHRSFGVKGFAPLAEVFEQSLSLRYRRLYRDAFGRVLRSVHLAGLLALAVLVQQLYRYMPAWRAGSTGLDVVLACEFVFAICFFAMRSRAAAGYRQRIFFDQCLQVGNKAVVMIWMCLPLIAIQEHIRPLLMSCLAGFLAFMLGLHLLIIRLLFRKALEDTALTEQQLAETI